MRIEWNNKVTEQTKRIMIALSLICSTLFFIVLLTPYSYANFCEKASPFYLHQSFTLKERFSSALCPVPVKPLGDEITENDAIAWNIETILFYIKLNFLISLLFIALYPIALMLKDPDEILHRIMFLFLFWNWLMGSLTFVMFIMGWLK